MCALFLQHRIALLALVFLGCTHARVDFGRDGQALTVDALLRRVTLEESTVMTLQGDGKLSVDTPQGKGTIRFHAAISYPASIRIELFDFFNRGQGMLVTDGQSFGFYDARAAKYYRGPATATNLARFLPTRFLQTDLSPGALTALLLARPPRLSSSVGALSFDEDARVYVLTLRHGTARQTLHIQPPSHRVIQSTFAGYTVEFSDIIYDGAVTLPRTMRLSAPLSKTRIEFTWGDVSFNNSLEVSLFKPSPPEGILTVELDAQGMNQEKP